MCAIIAKIIASTKVQFSARLIYYSLLYAHWVGQGHLETRSDGGDCDVDATEAVGTGRLKSTARGHNQAAMSTTDQLFKDRLCFFSSCKRPVVQL